MRLAVKSRYKLMKATKSMLLRSSLQAQCVGARQLDRDS